jgi:hypothetical protein
MYTFPNTHPNINMHIHKQANTLTHICSRYSSKCFFTYTHTNEKRHTVTHIHLHTHTNTQLPHLQDVEQVVLKVLKSITQQFRPGESYAINTHTSTTSMHRVRLTTQETSLHTSDSDSEQSRNATVVFPATLAASLSLPSTSSVDAVIHVSQNAPIVEGVVPGTPLVGVTISQSGSASALNVSRLSATINITLPLSASVANYRDMEYECMYWNGSVYSTYGCYATGVTTATSVQCACNHLTTFVARVSICVCMCVSYHLTTFVARVSIYVCMYVYV